MRAVRGAWRPAGRTAIPAERDCGAGSGKKPQSAMMTKTNAAYAALAFAERSCVRYSAAWPALEAAVKRAFLSDLMTSSQ